MARLDGKVAVITGGNRRYRPGCVEIVCRRGERRFALVDLDEAALREVVQSIGEDKASYTVADVTQPDQTQAYVNAAVNRWGGIDAPAGKCGNRRNPVSHPRLPPSRSSTG